MCVCVCVHVCVCVVCGVWVYVCVCVVLGRVHSHWWLLVGVSVVADEYNCGRCCMECTGDWSAWSPLRTDWSGVGTCGFCGRFCMECTDDWSVWSQFEDRPEWTWGGDVWILWAVLYGVYR